MNRFEFYRLKQQYEEEHGILSHADSDWGKKYIDKYKNKKGNTVYVYDQPKLPSYSEYSKSTHDALNPNQKYKLNNVSSSASGPQWTKPSTSKDITPGTAPKTFPYQQPASQMVNKLTPYTLQPVTKKENQNKVTDPSWAYKVQSQQANRDPERERYERMRKENEHNDTMNRVMRETQERKAAEQAARTYAVQSQQANNDPEKQRYEKLRKQNEHQSNLNQAMRETKERQAEKRAQAAKETIDARDAAIKNAQNTYAAKNYKGVVNADKEAQNQMKAWNTNQGKPSEETQNTFADIYSGMRKDQENKAEAERDFKNKEDQASKEASIKNAQQNYSKSNTKAVERENEKLSNYKKELHKKIYNDGTEINEYISKINSGDSNDDPPAGNNLLKALDEIMKKEDPEYTNLKDYLKPSRGFWGIGADDKVKEANKVRGILNRLYLDTFHEVSNMTSSKEAEDRLAKDETASFKDKLNSAVKTLFK